jgi:hypothetical protein
MKRTRSSVELNPEKISASANYIKFISEILTNKVTVPVWYKPQKNNEEAVDVPKSDIYKAYVNFHENETKDDPNPDPVPTPKKFWNAMSGFICKSNGNARSLCGIKNARGVPYINWFTEDEIEHNVKTANDAEIKSKENNNNKKGKEIFSFQKNQEEPSTKKLKSSLSSEQQINSMKKVAEFNNADSLKEKVTQQKIEGSSEKILKKNFNDERQINDDSSNNNNTFQTDLLSISDEFDDLRNENSSDIDEIQIDDLESSKIVENIPVSKENRHIYDKARIINYKGDAIEENNINNDKEHFKTGEESHQEIDENILFPYQKGIKKGYEKEKTWGINFIDDNTKNQNIFYIIRYNEKEVLFTMSTLKMLLELDPNSYV